MLWLLDDCSVIVKQLIRAFQGKLKCATTWKHGAFYHVPLHLFYISAQRCVQYLIYGLKDNKILRWLYSVMLLSWVSVRGGWLDSLVLDNCTLPRSVVPFSVSLWPRLREPYLGCMSSSSYLSHPHPGQHTPIRQKGPDKGTAGGLWAELGAERSASNYHTSCINFWRSVQILCFAPVLWT